MTRSVESSLVVKMVVVIDRPPAAHFVLTLCIQRPVVTHLPRGGPSRESRLSAPHPISRESRGFNVQIHTSISLRVYAYIRHVH